MADNNLNEKNEYEIYEQNQSLGRKRDRKALKVVKIVFWVLTAVSILLFISPNLRIAGIFFTVMNGLLALAFTFASSDTAEKTAAKEVHKRTEKWRHAEKDEKRIKAMRIAAGVCWGILILLFAMWAYYGFDPGMLILIVFDALFAISFTLLSIKKKGKDDNADGR